ncbi:hypothetical protein BpHYR1_052266 [Brachionus plicatilis]|uniref:Uncharacterized protein n=1 Tax=Brachionus plicatilis TaxID=10195 RepID=A0A3M7TAM2_BRAPC|nr:hypothetical protein BpHYR1_052266 [Brachionus plicatilis]
MPHPEQFLLHHGSNHRTTHLTSSLGSKIFHAKFLLSPTSKSELIEFNQSIPDYDSNFMISTFDQSTT